MRQLTKLEIKREVNKFYKRDKEIVLILENIQYARNVASIFRTAEASGVRRIYLTGISHQPPFGKELKQASRNSEERVEWVYKKTTGEVVETLKKLGFAIYAIELTDNSIELSKLKMHIQDKNKICFIAGSEVYGVTKNTLQKCDFSVLIPMYGKNASLNVSTSVGIALYSM